MLTYTAITGHKSKIIDILSAGHVKVICIYNQLFIFLRYHTDSDFMKDKNVYCIFVYCIHCKKKWHEKNLLFSRRVLLLFVCITKYILIFYMLLKFNGIWYTKKQQKISMCRQQILMVYILWVEVLLLEIGCRSVI